MKYFGKNDLNNAFKVVSGVGSTTIVVPFIPDYIKVDFHGPVVSSKPKEDLQGNDEVYWNLTAVTPTSYTLDIGWSVYSNREIYYRIARLTVDPV